MIYYTGIGAKQGSNHTVDEFLEVMNNTFTAMINSNVVLTEQERNRIPYLNFKTFNLPEDFINFTLEDWIEFSGAEDKREISSDRKRKREHH